jgi:hypothetical protein
LKQGLILAKRVICSNSLDVAQAMNEGGYSNEASTVHFMTAITWLASEFLNFKFQHNFYEANLIAHELARLAREYDQQVWLD